MTDSNGYYKGYNPSFKSVEEEGNIKNGEKDGDWKGAYGDITFKETYNNGKFVSGIATNKLGEVKNFNEPETLPQFAKGIDAFNLFLAKNIKYPERDRDRNVTGKVVLQFDVERDGTISNIKAVRSPTLAMAEESIRVLSLSPKWKPGIIYGFPVRAQFTQTIAFSLNERW